MSAMHSEPGGDAWRAEAGRQRRLLALLRDEHDAAVAGLAGPAAELDLGIAAYRANAAALAPRALAAAYPTVAQLMGLAAFAVMARVHWFQHPPVRGDLACWGERLPDAIAQDPQLATETYLADVARLDWAVHRASVAVDDELPPEGLHRLGEAEPEQLFVRLRIGTAVVTSAHPIVEIWSAHQDGPSTGPSEGTSADRFAAARAALRTGRAQAAWVTRAGGSRVQVLPLDQAGARLTQALLEGHSLDVALQLGGDGVDFEAWLIQALRHNALAAVLAVEV